MGLSEMIGIARLNGRMPREFVLIGVPPKELELHVGLSPELSRLLPEAVEVGRKIVEEWLAKAE